MSFGIKQDPQGRLFVSTRVPGTTRYATTYLQSHPVEIMNPVTPDPGQNSGSYSGGFLGRHPVRFITLDFAGRQVVV